MTSPLDQVSFRLGTLDANVNILIQRADRAEAERDTQLKLLHEVKSLLEPMAKKTDFMEPHVQHYAGVRKRAAWVNSMVIGIVSVFGSSVTTWFLRKYGG